MFNNLLYYIFLAFIYNNLLTNSSISTTNLHISKEPYANVSESPLLLLSSLQINDAAEFKRLHQSVFPLRQSPPLPNNPLGTQLLFL